LDLGVIRDMDVYKDLSGNYPDCIVTYFNFEEYAAQIDHSDKALFMGYMTQFRTDEIKEMRDKYKHFIFFNQEMPCAYTNSSKHIRDTASDLNKTFDHIYTICPLTGEWLNTVYNDGRDKYKPILFPIDGKRIIDGNEKIYDSIFYGSVCGKDHEECIDIIRNYKYNFITLGSQHWYPNVPGVDVNALSQYITHQNIHTFEKWKILSQTRTIPIYNQLYLHNNHIENIKKTDHWEKNEAWSHLHENRCPQLKPRVTEAAMFKMLMLVKRDPWNLIEHWYEPDKDFIYFDSNEELSEMIEDVNKNYEKYKPIVENAYNKAIKNYTTEALLKRMVEGVS
tara:strand:+ start:2275 stop:3285 length:1011 start_codon:yes stop_codon:yes gene_type:complete